jgi:hypothetical protein
MPAGQALPFLLQVCSALNVGEDIPDPAGAVPDLPEELRAFVLKA